MSQLQLTAVEIEEPAYKTQPQGRIDWLKVYHKDETVGKKFNHLPQPIPWTDDFETNVADTLEWLYRSGMKNENRFYPDSLFNEATDHWFRSERLPGEFVHVCYPQEMLAYRGRYDSIFAAIQEGGNITQAIKAIDSARSVLWGAYGCTGSDGKKVQPKPEDEATVDFHGSAMELHGSDIPYKHWKQEWTYHCSRCGSDIPKSIRLSIFLEMKLAKALA